MAAEETIEATVDKLEKKIKKLKKENSDLRIKSVKFDEVFLRAYILLDNLVRAAETMDSQAIEQTAGAGREFLDQNRP